MSAGEQNDTRELARKFARRTHFVHLRSTKAIPGGNFIESSHLEGRGHLIDLIRIFEKENPGLPMRVDHGRMMLGDEDKGTMQVILFMAVCWHWLKWRECWLW